MNWHLLFHNTQAQSRRHYTFFQKIAVQHSYPTKYIFDVIGMMWMVYFLWHHRLDLALTLGTGFAVVGSILSYHADVYQLLHTPVGRYVVARLHPANLFLQAIGFIVAFYGVWEHGGAVILAGLTFVFLGHLWGWNRKVMP